MPLLNLADSESQGVFFLTKLEILIVKPTNFVFASRSPISAPFMEHVCHSCFSPNYNSFVAVASFIGQWTVTYILPPTHIEFLSYILQFYGSSQNSILKQIISEFKQSSDLETVTILLLIPRSTH